MSTMNLQFNTLMKFRTLLGLPIAVSSLIILSFQSPSSAGPRDAILPSQQNEPAASTVKPSSPAAPRVEKLAGKKKKKSVYRQPSVLELFRDYRGERTPEAFTALFDQKQTVGFRQDPPVALSDGKAVVRLLFVSTADRKNISDVALTGARVVAAMKDTEATNTWIIAVLPEKGTDEVTMALLQHDVLMVYPVTVAPKIDIDLDRSGNVTEEDFRIFLNERGTPRAPAFDLNGDGVRDFRDDYLFTANYLALNPARESRAATLAPSAPAESEKEDERLYEPGDTVEQLPPEVEPEEDEAPDM
ncbi:MAG TPA: hypothetical protein VLG39_11555 [Nitrospirota bacterium]|nr:hypothetical protein [Nitrospirota bacterium]